MEIFELLEDYLIDQDDGLKKLLTWFFNLVMQQEAIQQSGAEPHERNETRIAQRNGYKERSLKIDLTASQKNSQTRPRPQLTNRRQRLLSCRHPPPGKAHRAASSPPATTPRTRPARTGAFLRLRFAARA